MVITMTIMTHFKDLGLWSVTSTLLVLLLLEAKGDTEYFKDGCSAVEAEFNLGESDIFFKNSLVCLGFWYCFCKFTIYFWFNLLDLSDLSYTFISFASVYLIAIFAFVTRGKSLLESWVITFLPDWQLPLIFVRFITNFFCMCSNSMASAHVILK